MFVLDHDTTKNRVVKEYSVRTDNEVSIGEAPIELLKYIRSAANVCPVSAIKVEIHEVLV